MPSTTSTDSGSVLKTGYGSEGFTTPFFHGAAQLLFSPEKSVLLFAPIVILVVLGSIRLWTAGIRFVVVLTLTEYVCLLRALGYLAFMARRLELGSAAASPRE